MTTQEITIRVSKTIQEQQYEPITAEVIIKESCPKKKYAERTAELLATASEEVFGYLGVETDQPEDDGGSEEGDLERFENGSGDEGEEGQGEEGYENYEDEGQGEEVYEDEDQGEEVYEDEGQGEGEEDQGEEVYEDEGQGEEGEEGDGSNDEFEDFFEDDPDEQS